MRFADLRDASIAVLGLGQEGLATHEFLRAMFPDKPLGLLDQRPLAALPAATRDAVSADPSAHRHCGADYLDHLPAFDLIVRSPGVPLSLPPLRSAAARGVRITSHTALFLANCPGTVVGITGTKGKSTTASLIHEILHTAGRDVHLVGNIGNPPLRLLANACLQTVFVYELSSHQLEGLAYSPQIAVLLGIVPDHLEHHGSFAAYVEAKRAITAHQSARDLLVYSAASEPAREIAATTSARTLPCGIMAAHRPGCFSRGDDLVYAGPGGADEIVMGRREVPLLGEFNLQNVLAAIAVGRALAVPAPVIAAAVRRFRPLAHRFELVGTFGGVRFYNAALATVPEATLQHLEALGPAVQTVLLGGYDRRLDFDHLARELVRRKVRTLILFPTTGQRIWESVERHRGGAELPQGAFVGSMDEAVRLAYHHTRPGEICLHSPASPSFGMFRDYRERGELFIRLVREFGEATGVASSTSAPGGAPRRGAGV